MLIDQLTLLAPERCADLDGLRAQFASEEQLTAEFVRRKWLTQLQGRWLLRGHGPRLIVGSYVLVDRIGEGGMGQVFLARHRTFGRPAAIKVLRPDRRDNRRGRARFLREVRALGRLDHPNVVHAYDAGVIGRACYLVMEYVPGPDLAQVIASGERLPVGHVCEYARQAALGLHHMHERGLIHRDVKPGNVSLAEGGRVVKLLDVGLVKDRVAPDADGDALTQAGWLVGTADYASPEQVLNARSVGRRSDQYALGCTLYHLLAGEVPFTGGTPVSRALRRVTENARPISELCPDLPTGLSEVVGRLLAREPKGRFPSALAAAEALAPFAALLVKAADETIVHISTCPTLPTLPTIDGPAATESELHEEPEVAQQIGPSAG